MLKQSLVQEKISELALLNNRCDNKPSSSGASASAGEDSDQQPQLGSSSATVVEIRRNANTNSSSSVNQTQTGMLPHIPQWPRLQIGTYSAHLLRTGTLKSTPHGNLDLVQSPTTSNTKIGKNVGLNAAATTEEQRASIDFDGAETLNNYSSRSHLKFMGTNYSTSSNSGHGNSNKLDSGGGSDQNQNSNNPQVKFAARQQESDEDLARRNELAYDNTLKLKYLEKSIRFIQQQHSETLHGLHQEIEKLKNENRELHFKLATRRSSDSIKSESGESKKAEAKPQQQEDVQQRKKSEATEKLRFDKMLKEVVRKEANLDNRLSDLKQMYELNRYDELLTRLKDAESKNEYLAKLVTQLEAKRSINSGFKPTAATTSVDNNANSSTKSTNGVKVISVEQIFSLEPLMVKTAENEEPRAPTSEESEILVKNLFALYKQQKQQIGNMKIVLRNVMQNENLSNSAFVITKQTLDNSTPNKISNNSSARQYHSQTLNNTMVTEQTNANAAFGPINSLALTNQQQAGANPNLNVSSVVHLPPLQSSNYSRFPERLKRTQYLQKQRLRRDFFH